MYYCFMKNPLQGDNIHRHGSLFRTEFKRPNCPTVHYYYYLAISLTTPTYVVFTIKKYCHFIVVCNKFDQHIPVINNRCMDQKIITTTQWCDLQIFVYITKVKFVRKVSLKADKKHNFHSNICKLFHQFWKNRTKIK